jgi:nicotinate-nucleotide adenylyltransferase
VGHVALAEEAVRHFRLERLLVRVVADPGHKEVGTAPQIRLLLAELAFAALDEAEVALDPCARTVDSLEQLGFEDPVFLIGADEFADFLDWKEPDRVLALARLGVATRPGTEREVVEAVLAGVSRPDRVEVFAIEPLDVSSSGIRARIVAGEPVDGLVPRSVAAELERLGLYRDE